MSLYCEWLSSAVDTDEPATRAMLDFMSSFESLEYKNAKLLLLYARHWCHLSRFLFAHREEQLRSDKVQMLFDVAERRQRTDVYWFEVARACDILATETMQNLLQDLEIMAAVEAKRGYAETALRLKPHTLTAALISTKAAIGVCHYSLRVADVNCKYLRQCSPKMMDSILRRYQTFRVIGCWLQGVHQLVQCEAPQLAADWFETCKSIATEGNCTGAIAPLLESAIVLLYHGFIHKALRENQRGVALGFMRDVEPSYSAKQDPAVIQALKIATALPKGAAAPAVPSAGSPLLKITGRPKLAALELGTSPFSEDDAPLKRPK